MNITTAPSLDATQTVELAPSFAIPLVLMLGAVPLLFVPLLGLQIWISGAIALFGVFLLIQTLTLRLQFTPVALEIYRSGRLIRQFPYAEWQNWEIFWSPLPILFYFKEINSIHFLPIIFQPQTLRACLETRFPKDSKEN